MDSRTPGSPEHTSEGAGEAPNATPDPAAPTQPKPPSPAAPNPDEASRTDRAQRTFDAQRLLTGTCCECLYPLRGLTRDDVCPECGTPIADTLRPRRRRDPLRLTPVRTLRRMSRGLSMAFWGATGLFVVCWAAAFAAYRAAPQALPPAYGTLFIILMGLIWLTVQAGLFLFSTPETDDAKHHSYIGELLRISAAVLFVGAIPTFLVLAFHAQTPLSGLRSLGCLAPVGFLGLGGAMLLQTLALPAYIEELSRRIPDPALAKQARRRKYLGPFVTMASAMLGGVLVILVLIMTIGERLRKQLNAIIIAESKPSSTPDHINSPSTISNVSSPPGSRT